MFGLASDVLPTVFFVSDLYADAHRVSVVR